MDDLQKRLYNMWNVDVSRSSTELIVHSLEIHNKVFVERGEHLVANKTLVKIASCGKDVEPITELEKNFFKLKETEKILIGEISNLDVEKESLVNEAKCYLSKNMKPIVSKHLTFIPSYNVTNSDFYDPTFFHFELNGTRLYKFKFIFKKT